MGEFCRHRQGFQDPKKECLEPLQIHGQQKVVSPYIKIKNPFLIMHVGTYEIFVCALSPTLIGDFTKQQTNKIQ